LAPKRLQLIQPFSEKALSDTKSMALQKATEQSKRISLSDAQGKPRLLAPSQEFYVMNYGKPLGFAPESAHILIWQAPPDLDQSMILEIPKDFCSNMPIIKGLPPFSGDFRGVFNQPPSANPFFAPDTRKQPK
jgi:hypothetical protein